MAETSGRPARRRTSAKATTAAKAAPAKAAAAPKVAAAPKKGAAQGKARKAAAPKPDMPKFEPGIKVVVQMEYNGDSARFSRWIAPEDAPYVTGTFYAPLETAEVRVQFVIGEDDEASTTTNETASTEETSD